MTFANLSLNKAAGEAGQGRPDSRIPSGRNSRGPWAWYKGMFGRRMWTIGISVLYAAVYFLVGTVMIITRSNYRAALSIYTPEATLSQRLYEVSKWIGLRQQFWFIPAFFGILLGIEGFSYLFSMVKMDFYESQPMPRGQRFRRVYLNGVLIFAVPYLIAYAIAIVIATAMGGMTGLLFMEILAAAAQMLIVFLVSYTIAVFAVMLSGNAGIAVIVTGIIMCAEYVYYVALNGFTYTFYKTYYYAFTNYARPYDRTITGYNWFKISPLMRVGDLLDQVDRIDRWAYVPFNKEMLDEALRVLIRSNIGTLAVGMVFLVAAFALYRKRRAEAAGDTVIYPFARWILKMIVVVGGALLFGIEIFYPLFSEISGSKSAISVMMILAMLCFVVILSGIIQGIYDMNAKRFLAKLWQAGVSAVIVAGIFAVYRYDLTGYDTYLPAISDVAYASLVTYDNSSYAFGNPQRPGEQLDGYEYSARYMQLTDIYTVEQLAQIGMATQVHNADSDNDYIDGWSVAVVYTMNNGRQVGRQLFIPYDIDSDLMDQIVGSEEYKEGFFPVYQENNTYIESTQDNAFLVYTNGQDQRKGDASLYAEFCEAYRKDLKQYNYSYAVSHYPVGAISYNTNDEYGGSTRRSQLEVYPEYSNTIQFLKDHDLYVEAMEVSGTVKQIAITHYTTYDSRTTYYTDADEIRQILQSSVLTGISRSWDTYTDVVDEYGIETRSERPQDDSYASSRRFRIGEIPQFVMDDLGAPEDEGAATAQADVVTTRNAMR